MHDWTQFTETAYFNLLSLAKSNYKFIKYTGNLKEACVLLWRHDVDFSVHRAFRLAEIEKTLDLTSTFFFQLSSPAYNIFEDTIIVLIKEIIYLGHSIGLHFNPSLYKDKSKDEKLEKILWEKNILETLLETNIHAVSFHNPEFDDWISVDAHFLHGMINTYSRFFKENFTYCSDSNGYWRFESIGSVLRNKKNSRLQILTHPENWTKEPLPPRKRIQRCFEGRAARCLEEYDRLLLASGRMNIDD